MPRNTGSSLVSYNTVISCIRRAAKKIMMRYPPKMDGRLASALLEKAYLGELTRNINKINKKITIVNTSQRSWCDIIIGGIPINLKITNGGTDNIYNARAICSTCGSKLNNDISQITSIPIVRVKREEYHYLVVHKKTNKVLIKSILDLSEYKSNASNVLQVNWSREFLQANYKTRDHISKKRELLRAIQTSFQRRIMALKQFAEMNIDIIFQ